MGIWLNGEGRRSQASRLPLSTAVWACDDSHAMTATVPKSRGVRIAVRYRQCPHAFETPAYKQTDVFAWGSKSRNDSSTEFSRSAFTPNKPSREFANSLFLDAASQRPTRRRKRRFVLLLWGLIMATLGLVLLAVVGLLDLLP